jgi:hypothetical protein
MRPRWTILGWTCTLLLVSLTPIACSESQPKRADENPNRPGWHEVRLLERTGVIADFRPVRPQKPVEYPVEYELNDGAARLRFARPRTSDGPDLEIEGASDEFADRILETLERRGLSASK